MEQKGYNATGIQEIITIAGIPKGSFYNYFASKEEFAVEIIRFYSGKNIEQWENLLEAADTGNSYLALSTVFVQLAERYEHAVLCPLCQDKDSTSGRFGKWRN